MKVVASAPGKVVILGEYAVLEGAPALAMAVDRRVRVELTSHRGPHWSVAAPGWADGSTRFDLDACGQPQLGAGGDAFRMPAHVIGRLFSHLGRWPPDPFHLSLESTALMQRGSRGAEKLGLGSSAALTVALAHALGYYVASQHDELLLPDLSTLVDIHSSLQARPGSGVDVAASLRGGLIEYSRLPSPQALPAELPAGVECCFVWSGLPAVTGRFLEGVDQWRRGHQERFRRVMAPLAEIAQGGAQAARTGNGDEFLKMVREYSVALETLGEASGTDILSQSHRQLRALAARYGVAYKPCGAGGGDIGVGMSMDPEALAGFRAGLVAGNLRPLALKSDRKGVLVQSES